ncbi:sporulation integral membrane protein YlbJ [Garciella nitratireducens]|uniref:Sporulation integral membrane protein YlbJ n=1 Tax=Garciella nitratireducens DSM 15102 TaxID=1121911 RepID=A0A1T4JYN6_9FIRM|nr:sporulation integral membrane protein YlbJ [Garciella nitratireducens]SJZ35283.1 sporulation integral membrane protein YlbJ [Garciella nitratireducens DSM 15102]
MKKKLFHIITAFSFLCILILMVIYPNQSYHAAKNGLNIWLNNVLPSLLPFFISTELLIGLGVVNFISVLLEPIMYPIFKVPGAGSFVYAMSITSGYPMGTKITTELRNKKICSQVEAQRLLAFCSTSGPLFIIGSVAVGMFHNSLLGWMILLSHYFGSITTGLCFRNYGNKKSKEKQFMEKTFQNPFTALFEARKNDGRKLGILLGDAVKNSFNSLLNIGGFIIFFSVLIELFSITEIFDIFSNLLSPFFFILNISNESIKGFLSGIIEMTNGINIISGSEDSLIIKGILTSFIISWGGFSIHGQAISFISKTDLKVFPYLIAKILHGFFASIFFLLLSKISIFNFKNMSTTVFSNSNIIFLSQINWIDKLIISTSISLNIILSLICIGCLFFIFFRVKNKFFSHN